MTRLLPLILAVLLLPVAGSVTESRVASVAVGPSEGASWSAPATRIGTVLIEGNISWADPSLGSRYLAVRADRGTWVRVCAVTCLTLRSTDYGPSSRIRPPRIADLALGLWRTVCGLPKSAGLCEGTIEIGVAPSPTGPPTDAAP